MVQSCGNNMPIVSGLGPYCDVHGACTERAQCNLRGLATSSDAELGTGLLYARVILCHRLVREMVPVILGADSAVLIQRC